MKPDEVVICDDVSKDDTVSKIRQYASKSTLNIRLIQNEKNLGYPWNFQQAISLCEGQVIFLCDQDDIWNKNKVQRMLEEFECDEQLVFLFTDARVVNANREVFAKSLWEKGWTGRGYKWDKLDNQEYFNLFITGKYPPGCLAAVRKEFVCKIIPFPTLHDRWIASCAAGFGNIKAIKETLIDYRRHSGNTTETVTVETKKCKGPIYRLRAIRELLSNSYEDHFVYPTSLYEVTSAAYKYVRDGKNSLDMTYMEDQMTYLKSISDAKNQGIVSRIQMIRKLSKTGLYNRFRSESHNLYRIDTAFLVINAFKRKKNR